MNTQRRYVHGIWYPIEVVEPIPLQPTQIWFTEGAKTNYELWQMEKYGNYIKAVGSEHQERFITKEKTI